MTAQIPGTERAHRSVPGTDAPGAAEVHLVRSTAQEAADAAHVLRGAHLHEGVPWHRMAVLVRSGSRVSELRRALISARVPVEVLGSDLPLRSEPAVRPLLVALACVLDPELLAEHATTLLISPLGGLDPIGLRRVRRALRGEELAGGGTRTSDPLLVEVLEDPRRATTLPSEQRVPVQRLAGVLAAGRRAMAEPGTGVLDVLWALWSAAGLAEPWRRSALAGGPAGARADRDLDAVLALFTAAEQFVDRLPQASPQAFLDHLESQDLPSDTLAAHGAAGDAVAVLTAAGAAGLEWDVVVVAGVQEGVWPDLRLRDSMLGAAHLVEVMAGRAGARESAAQSRQAVLADELRAFAVAVSRATRRLVVTAVRDAEQQASPLVDLVAPAPEDEGADPRLHAVPAALDLRALVARLRVAVEDDDQSPAAGLLAYLASRGVDGADPDSWAGTRELSSTEPLWSPDGPVPMSPSKVEQASTCALRWALEAVGGTAATSQEQSLGVLLHAVAAALPQGSEDELRALVAQRWPELGLPDGWLDRQARRRADGMVGKLASYLRTAGEPVALEQEFRVRLGRVEVHGFVDRLEDAGFDGRPLLRVVDLKTGGTAVSLDDASRHPQLGLYQAAVDAGGFDEVAPGARSAGATLVYVGTSSVRVDHPQPAGAERRARTGSRPWSRTSPTW